MKSPIVAIVAGTLLIAAPVSAQKVDCSGARPCNPRQECVAKAEQKLQGAALEAAKKDCARMPTSGTCYGGPLPAECAEAGKKQK